MRPWSKRLQDPFFGVHLYNTFLGALLVLMLLRFPERMFNVVPVVGLALASVGMLAGATRSSAKAYEDRMRRLEEEIDSLRDKLRARLAVEQGILPSEGAAVTDRIFMPPEAPSGIRHRPPRL